MKKEIPCVCNSTSAFRFFVSSCPLDEKRFRLEGKKASSTSTLFRSCHKHRPRLLFGAFFFKNQSLRNKSISVLHHSSCRVAVSPPLFLLLLKRVLSADSGVLFSSSLLAFAKYVLIHF